MPTRTGINLVRLADQINKAHTAGEKAQAAGEKAVAAGEKAIRKGLEHYRKAGEALLAAKAQCPHGTWKKWCKENVQFSQQREGEYRKLAEHWDKLPPGGTLGLKAALDHIAAAVGKRRRQQSTRDTGSKPNLPDDGKLSVDLHFHKTEKITLLRMLAFLEKVYDTKDDSATVYEAVRVEAARAGFQEVTGA